MDSFKGKAGEKPQPRQTGQPIYEDFHPSIKWVDDTANHILQVYLPGFNKEDLRVQLDSAGKLTVKGLKRVDEGRYTRLQETYDVPKDSDSQKTTGRFEDGWLTLIMPKKVVEQEVPQKAIPSGDGKKEKIEEKEVPQKAIPSDDGKKEVEEKESPQEKPESEVKKEEVEEKEAPQEKPASEVKKKEVEEKEVCWRTLQSEEQREKDVFHGKRERCEDGEALKAERKGKEGVFWKEGKWHEWLEHGLIDNLYEKIINNRKIIAVAVVSFSVGFYVCHKLRSRRT